MKEFEHIVKCRSCQADIVFLRTKKGSQMPVDAGTVEHDDFHIFQRARMRTSTEAELGTCDYGGGGGGPIGDPSETIST